MILLTITLELGTIYKIFEGVGNILNNIPPLNIFPNLHLPAVFHQQFQAAFGCCES